MSPLGPAGPLMPGSPDSPGTPAMPGVPGSPGLPASPWQREGTKVARGHGTRGPQRPLSPPTPPGATLSPSHLLSLLAIVAGSALGKRRNGSGWGIPPKNGHGGHGEHSPLCPGGRQDPSLPVAPAVPPLSLSPAGLAGWEGTARTARPAMGTSRRGGGFGDRSQPPAQRCPMPRCQLGQGRDRGVPSAGLTFSPLSPLTPGSPFSPGIPCTRNPQQR